MRSCRACLSVAVVFAALLFGALPALAKPAESQDYSFSGELQRRAAALTSAGERALNVASDVAARVYRHGKAKLAEAETDAAQLLRSFRQTLNERKARVGMIDTDVAARLRAWTHEATEALHWFQDWLKKHSASDEPTEISV